MVGEGDLNSRAVPQPALQDVPLHSTGPITARPPERSARSIRGRAGHDALGVLGPEELRHGDRSRDNADEPGHGLLAGLDRPKEPLQLGRWRLQARRIVEVLAVARDTQWS